MWSIAINLPLYIQGHYFDTSSVLRNCNEAGYFTMKDWQKGQFIVCSCMAIWKFLYGIEKREEAVIRFGNKWLIIFVHSMHNFKSIFAQKLNLLTPLSSKQKQHEQTIDFCIGKVEEIYGHLICTSEKKSLKIHTHFN